MTEFAEADARLAGMHGYAPAKGPCQHCFHRYEGPVWMVLPDGHVLEKCCRCGWAGNVHRDHAHA